MLAPTPPRPPSLLKRVMAAFNTPAPPPVRAYSEMGVSGTAVYSGFVQIKERSSQWIGAQRYITISDMAVNASIVAAGVHYFLNLIAHPKWTFEPADESAEAAQAAEFVDECLQDLSQPWSRVVRRAGAYRFYGFGVQEWTAKKRRDGKIGLESIETRPQATIEQWSVDEAGAVIGVWQRGPQTGELFGIPRKKLLYLVDDVLSDSPEGVGIFRHLAEPWERLKQYYVLEARAFERDLRGTPVGRVPYTMIREAVAQGDITKADADKMVAAMESFVKLQVKQSDTAITLDSIPYYSQAADGSKVAAVPQWGLELLQGGSAGMGEVAAAITRTQTEMARIIACEGLMMGEQSGNRALGEDKSRNLYLIGNAVLSDIIAGVEQDIIPVICDLNGIAEELRPVPKVEDIAFKDAEAVASVLAKMAQAGAVLQPDDPVIEDVRSLMGVSPPPPPTPEMLGLGLPEPGGPEDDGGGEGPGLGEDGGGNQEEGFEVKKEWSDEARAAALEARRRHMKPEEKPSARRGSAAGDKAPAKPAASGKLEGAGASKIPKADLEARIEALTQEMEDINDASYSLEDEKDIEENKVKYVARDAIITVMRNDLKAKAKPEIAGNEKFAYARSPKGDIVAAIHYSHAGDSISIEWLGNVGLKGTGKRLIAQAEADAAKVGAKEVKLKAKWGAEKVYQRLGYELTGETNPFADWVAMRKPLDIKKEWKASDPRSLYVCRRLLNAGAVREWAKEQGFSSALPAGDMHVTVAYSKEPVDWSMIDPQTDAIAVPAGARAMHRFDGGATVLTLESADLTRRHQALRDAGASWDYPDYKPHVTITYDAGDVELDAIEPYRGPLIFGPEELAEVNEDGFDPDGVEEQVLKSVNSKSSSPRIRRGRKTS